MNQKTTMESELMMPPIPAQAEVPYRLEVSFQCTITPFVARQTVNVYVLTHVGNMLSSGDPVLCLGEHPCWKVPVFCAFPDVHRREQIGEMAVDTESGAILLEQSHPSSPQEMERYVEHLYHSLVPPSPGA